MLLFCFCTCVDGEAVGVDCAESETDNGIGVPSANSFVCVVCVVGVVGGVGVYKVDGNNDVGLLIITATTPPITNTKTNAPLAKAILMFICDRLYTT